MIKNIDMKSRLKSCCTVLCLQQDVVVYSRVIGKENRMNCNETSFINNNP